LQIILAVFLASGISILEWGENTEYKSMYHQMIIQATFLPLFLVFVLTSKNLEPHHPTVELKPPLPNKPRGYYRRHRHVRQYYLRRRVLRRPVARPIRDPPRSFFRPWTWCWTRRTPVPSDRNGTCGAFTRPHRKVKRKRKPKATKSPAFTRMSMEEAEQNR